LISIWRTPLKERREGQSQKSQRRNKKKRVSIKSEGPIKLKVARFARTKIQTQRYHTKITDPKRRGWVEMCRGCAGCRQKSAKG